MPTVETSGPRKEAEQAWGLRRQIAEQPRRHHANMRGPSKIATQQDCRRAKKR